VPFVVPFVPFVQFSTAGIKLFMKKWKDNRNKEVQTFLDYFQMQWLDSYSGWFESYAPGVPSTNNSLEAINYTVKALHTLRERLPLSRFLIVGTNLVKSWSLDRNPNRKNAKYFALWPADDIKAWTMVKTEGRGTRG
jgi:hypothetical protein